MKDEVAGGRHRQSRQSYTIEEVCSSQRHQPMAMDIHV